MENVRYICTMRPPDPGAAPRNGLTNVSFEEGFTRSGRHFWGIVEYNRHLTEEETWQYDLVLYEEDKQ